MNLITPDVLTAAVYTMRFYSDKMDKRSLSEPEFMAWQKVCRFVEAIFDTASQNVLVDGQQARGLPVPEPDFTSVPEPSPEAAVVNKPQNPTLLMQFAQYCLMEDLDAIPAIARKSLFPKGEFVPVHILYATLADHLYRTYSPTDFVVEFDKDTHELRFTWRGETVEVRKDKQPPQPKS